MPENTYATKADLDAMEHRMLEEIRHYIDERTRDMQTELLRGFARYEEGASIRLAKLTADVSNIDTATDKRLTIVEDRLTEIERRIIQKGL